MFPCDVISCAAMSGRINLLLSYTLAFRLMQPDWTSTAADDMVVSPLGYMAMVGMCLILDDRWGTAFSGMDVSSAPQSRIGVSDENIFREFDSVLAMRE